MWHGSVGCEDATGDVVQEPVNAQQQVLPGDSAAALDAPVVAVDGVQLQGLWDGDVVCWLMWPCLACPSLSLALANATSLRSPHPGSYPGSL